MKRFILNRSDGGVSIMSILDDSKVEDEILKSQFDIISFRELTENEVLPRRDYREAWSDQGKTIEVDLEKAKEVKRQFLRKERVSILNDLDVESIKALESNDSVKLEEVKNEKQRLRDAPSSPAIDNATSLEDLDAITINNIGKETDGAEAVSDTNSAGKKLK